MYSLWFDPTWVQTYTRYKHANHYITDAVSKDFKFFGFPMFHEGYYRNVCAIRYLCSYYHHSVYTKLDIYVVIIITLWALN